MSDEARMIAFTCPHCGKQYNLKPEFAGRKTTCAGCKEPLVVPGPEAASAEQAEAQARISFPCTKCGMKFNLLSEFAGRKTTCPSCKEPLVVPSPDHTAAYVPPAGQIDGPPSSLAQAGVDAGVNLVGIASNSSVQNLLAGKSANSTRYIIDKELARGGMGAVLRAVDCDIRREVAVKYLLDQTSATNKLRFVEEAQITGQLEHPNIVPIHELGVDAQKRIFFAMKMVNGRSLGQILKMLRDEPADAEKEYTLNRLLNIFVNVCNGLAYAHSRGVVHRDLKPANIMVGDFGEVYVMDWGLAKVLDQSTSLDTSPPMAIPVAPMAVPMGDNGLPVASLAPPLATPVETPPSSGPGGVTHSSGTGKVVTSRELDADLTQAGAVLGTPVYMPPEQAAGKIQEIDERSDIYSMGAILYEILTLKPPIDRAGGFWPIILRVSQGQIQAPELKAPERAQAGRIPVELSAVAMKSLAKLKADRYQSVEALRKDIERFLEGRSVSARQDTIREMAKKFVKRNKGVSAGLALAFLVLLGSLVVVFSAWRDTSRAYAAFEKEQGEKEKRTREAVPAFLKAARQAVEHRELDDAMAQVSVALDYDGDNGEALLLKGQLLVSRKEFAAAAKVLDRYVQIKPDDLIAAKLAKLCAAPRGDPPSDADGSGGGVT